ncbi:NAD(P)/FAD-dependent oxidoreductase [Brevundimonas sp. FT23028]|uniref:NAD(P)/FAD-dependent oxidoreductase n=1 Tax=Brevundimonas sp. FT23028 TaxID=3393748 RepID=UPI003B587595
MSSSPRVIVIGAGVLGLSSAAELAARGHAVTVLDPGGPNASSAAAGMIAPAMESLIDGLSAEHAALLKRGRDLWPAFAGRHGLALHLDGAEWRGSDPDAAVATLHRLGFAAGRAGEGLFTPDDWRIEAQGALAALSSRPGVTRVEATVTRLSRADGLWTATAADERHWTAPTVVLATGAASALPGLPDVAALLVNSIEPIRGQLTPIVCATPDRVLRGPGGYATPTTDGALCGATMQSGDRSTDPDMEIAAKQVANGVALIGAAAQPGPPRVGIRGASPDGLPMAGPSGAPGLHLALAPRRNGWLLGPMVGRVVADGIEGRAPLADAAALSPLRFA